MPYGQAHMPEVRAAATADLLAGESVKHVALTHGLPLTTVKTWKAELGLGGPAVRPEKQEELGQLVAEYLSANLRALRAQSELAGNREYLKEQDADKLAILHGVMADKSIRILNAIQRAEAQQAEAD